MAFREQFWRRPQSLWLRKAMFQIHLWTGIAIGVYVIAISVSGSALFFRSKILEAAPGRQIVAGSGRLLGKEELRAAALRAYPGYVVGNIWLGSIPGQEVEIWLARGNRQTKRIFDPYTGKDLGESVPYSLQAITWLLDLHVNLSAGPKGRIVNGAFAILLTLLVITGAVIWWPGVMNWRRSLGVNPRAGWKRLNWELHSAIGFWSFAFLFMWALTGVYLVFPTPFHNTIQRFLPLDYYRIVASGPPALSAEPILPVADEGSRPIRKRRRPVFHYSAGDKIIRAFYALHFGNFAGLGTRVVWALFGLTPVLLFLTGAVMWWNRVLSREARRLRRGVETVRAMHGATA
ncbi:MAG TPA: PepSY-associated TM helix domain-containing protein [Bryobacteraceae bacterium]|nr:PepSY-associated TM helix domain-containing protein [Bryobacteraceae bacterium]